MTVIRDIICKKRGCGFRREGMVYLVTEPGEDGILPLWTDIDPPIFHGAQFRGTIAIDLDKLLAGEPYLTGSSEERERRERLLSPDVESFGIPRRTRLRTGICRERGLEAISQVTFLDIRSLGIALRNLGGYTFQSASQEVPKAWRALQDRRPDQVLACLWRLWNGAPRARRPDIAPWVRIAMAELNAPEDAQEIKS